MFDRSRFENTRPDGIPVLEVVTEAQDSPRQFVALQKSELNGDVAGPLASLTLTQVFGYSREACDKVLEALYRFPLPGDAAVTEVRVTFGDVAIEARLKERAQAEAEYEEAKAKGQQAALATRESPDVFTLRLAGLHPDQPIRVETSYVLAARAEGRGYSLRIPLTTAPRYVRSDERGSRHADGQPLGLLRDPGHRFSLRLGFQAAAAVTSPTHRLATSGDGRGALSVSLEGGEVLPDRDCVLRWTPLAEERRPSLQVLLHDDPRSEHVYFLALAAPPSRHQPGTGVPREVVLLVDRSGSMSGAKWEASDWAVNRFLGSLTPKDSFALGIFHSSARWLSKRPMAATPGAIQKAKEFLGATDSGGTELGVALEQALHLERLSGEHSRPLLVVTDAEVSDEARVLRLAVAEAKRPDRRRISVLCIDAAPNSFLARELAERGGGAARFLTSDPEHEDITTALDELLADWDEPVLAGLRLEVDRAGLETDQHVVAEAARGGWSALDLGDLPCGRAVWCAGRVPRGESASLTFRVVSASGEEVAVCAADASSEGDYRPAVKALFGARRVLGLEFLMNAGYEREELLDQLARLGYDPASALTALPPKGRIYAENTRVETADALKALLVRESIDYGIACSETGFIAVRTECGEKVSESVAVANALPHGWSNRFVGYAAAGAAMPSAAYRCSAPAPASLPMQVAAAGADLADADIPAFLRRGRAVGRGIAGAVRTLTAAMPATPRNAHARASAEALAGPPTAAVVVTDGPPAFIDGQAILFDTDTDPRGPIAHLVVLGALEVRWTSKSPSDFEPDITLELYVDDLTEPRVKVRLADLLSQGGRRPINVRISSESRVALLLNDPRRMWPAGVSLAITLR